MATAGARYEERTGNIWSYAHRGDMTGLKAALARGVDVNLSNTVGWTACHAAAAGGRTQVLRYLVTKAGAELDRTDRGGDLPVHHAAKHGHVHALRVLQELGGDVTKVRLSHTKGKAVRDFVVRAYRDARHDGTDDPTDDADDAAVKVGYARKQSRSTAFWGPRRTPSSGKIKKNILKNRRKLRKEKRASHDHEQATSTCAHPAVVNIEEPLVDVETNEPSYLETVQHIKRTSNKQRKARHQRTKSSINHEPVPKKVEHCNALNRTEEEYGHVNGLVSTSESSDEDDDGILRQSRFAALTLFDDDSDSE